MKGRILQHVKGKDGVIRGAIVLHKGNRLERPLQLLCPLEIRSEMSAETPLMENKERVHSRERRTAPKNADATTQLMLDDE